MQKDRRVLFFRCREGKGFDLRSFLRFKRRVDAFQPVFTILGILIEVFPACRGRNEISLKSIGSLK